MISQKQKTSTSKNKRITSQDKILNLNPDNIEEAQKVLEILKRNSFLESVKGNNINDEKSLKVLKDAGFFNLGFLNNKKPISSVGVSKQDIEEVFQLISNNKSTKSLKVQDLKSKIHVLNPRVPEIEVPTLTNNKEEITVDELYNLLSDCDYKDFDPVAEAFKLLDIHNNDAVDMDRLVNMMQKFGFKNITHKDKDLLLECLDVDGDSMVTLNDLRKVLQNDVSEYEEEELI